MSYKQHDLSALKINRANDRHGELENETAAIAWLLNKREQHMKNLARDIVETREVYAPPLVAPDGDGYLVFDGNRRVTVLEDPRKAPNAELSTFFAELKAKWERGWLRRRVWAFRPIDTQSGRPSVRRWRSRRTGNVESASPEGGRRF